MRKLIDVKNAEQEKAFELHGNPDALYLSVKCSDNKHHSRIVVIKVSDALYQIAKTIGPERWKAVCEQASSTS